VRGEYTDNVFASGRRERDEYIVTASVGFTARLFGKNSGIEASYDPAYQWYEDFDENDGWIHDARVYAYSDLTKRTRLRFFNQFFLSRDPLGEDEYFRDDEVLVEGDPTKRTDRNKFYRNTANARITHQFGADDIVYAGFLHSILRNDSPDEEDNDRYEPSVGLNYWFGPKFGIQTRGVYTRGEFDQDSDFTGNPTDDFDNYAGRLRMILNTTRRHFSLFAQYNQIYRDYEGDSDDSYLVYAPSAGFQYLVDQGLRLRLGAGYFYQELDNDDNNDGIFINGEVDKRWNYRRGSINLNGTSGVDQQNFGARNLGLERFAQARAAANYSFFRTLSGNVSGRIRYSDVVNSNESQEDTSGELRTQANAGMSWLPYRWMTWSLEYRYTKYAADGDLNYDENRVGLTLTLRPDQPWRF
jgi:hypothetical protein